jgi:hypothetical protein
VFYDCNGTLLKHGHGGFNGYRTYLPVTINGKSFDWQVEQEQSEFGAARRLPGPVKVRGTALQWDRPAARLGSSPAHWET